MFRHLLFAVCLSSVAAISTAQAGGHHRAPCGPVCQRQCHYVQKVIHVPTTHYETRTVMCTRFRPEARQRTIQVACQVPVTKEVTRLCTVYDYQQRKKTVQHTVCRPVWREVERQITVMVPHVEQRTGYRSVCKMVTETSTRTVCEDQGGFVSNCHVDPCSGCNYCCKVWVPKIVTKQVPCTVMKPVYEKVPCTYSVTVCRPEQRTCKVRVCDYVNEVVEKPVVYTVCIPRQVERKFHVTHYRCEYQEKVIPCTVMVPYKVQQQIQVPICKMVAKTITVPVYTCGCRPCHH